MSEHKLKRFWPLPSEQEPMTTEWGDVVMLATRAVAECACGWSSATAKNETIARALHAEHAEAHAASRSAGDAA